MAAPTEPLTATEADMYVETLKPLGMKEIGSPRWLKQHDMLEKLNIQAHINAMMNTDEFIHESFLLHDKVGLLIYELIEIETWREKVKPELMKLDYADKSTIIPYMVEYHEATVLNLLEAIFFHEEAVETSQERSLDLVDYCHRWMSYLASRTEDDIERELKLEAEAAALNEQSGSQQLRYQTRTLAFDISIKAVGVFRYLTDSITKLPLATMTRILNNHDFPTLLVTLLDTTPWVRYDEGKLYKYIDSKWTEIAASDRFQLTQLEGQLWLAAYNLLMEPECRRKYEYNSHNKQEILKLKGHLNAVLLDQLPILTELRRSLEELSLLEPPAAQSGIVLEQLPELKLHLETTNKGKWASIAAYQYNNVFSPKEDTRKMQAKLLASTYNLDHLEAVFPEEPKCAVCGEDAVMRCSACSSEWYCRRQCQVEHWPKHKELCKKLSQALKAQRDESG